MALKRKVRFINKDTSKEVSVPIGFSWTTAFFFPFVPLFRKDWKNFGIQLGVVILLICALSTVDNLIDYIPTGLGGLFFAFLYNKMYIKSLIEKGYHVKNEDYSFHDRNKDAYLFGVPDEQSLPK
ncbi:DUF2628 domain-containing protein [Streptococcus parauberis]|uniref:DUF2628 domain-containing protein n=1 Tax=Streptococcus parauberis TaxID=1348 RepID=UPI00379CF06D